MVGTEEVAVEKAVQWTGGLAGIAKVAEWIRPLLRLWL